MAREIDLTQWQSELVDAFRWGEQERARSLVMTLREAQPRRVHGVLEQMLQSPDGKVRQAAVFALGELGGPTSAKRLEQQLLLEESRGNSDASSVVQVITQALSQIESASSRATLVRRLNRLAAGAPEGSDVDDVVYALWRKRHPELIPAVRGALKRISLPASEGLRALLRLLENSPQELRVWIEDGSVPVEQKTKALTVLDEAVPEELEPVIPSFIFLAGSMIEMASTKKGQERRFCDRLFTLLLLHRERLLSALPSNARIILREVARRMIAAPETVRIIKAATLLGYVGRREDVGLLAEHKPRDEVLGRVYEEAAEVLRKFPHA
ncbi:HEAT repeat domain-containing protein [Archangium violaceum]|uniref:HEAT repeat domain-containing protein n=1 Tax=Archangium violaceum TaxID=83451 RepID=UPI002B31BD38|nr:HEAT repeat domain-containing protein [Archangium gephyra]